MLPRQSRATSTKTSPSDVLDYCDVAVFERGDGDSGKCSLFWPEGEEFVHRHGIEVVELEKPTPPDEVAWRMRAYLALLKRAAQPGSFTAAEVRELAGMSGVPVRTQLARWGGVFKRAHARGQIRPARAYAKGSHPRWVGAQMVIEDPNE